MDERHPTGFVVGMEDLQQILQPLGRHVRPHLGGDGVANATEILHVRAAELGSAHPDPREMGGEVVPPRPPRDLAGLGLLIEKVQGVVARVEVDAVDLPDAGTGEGFHEAERFTDRFHGPLVFRGPGGMPDEVEVPVLRVMQVRKPAVDQAADEVQGQGGPFVAPEHPLGIRRAGRLREARAVDEVPPVAEQRLAVSGLGVGGPRLGVLAREPSHPDHALAGPVNEHQAHLQQDLELVGDDARLTLIEALSAVASLKQPPSARGCLGEVRLEGLDLPGRHEGGQLRQLGDDPVHIRLDQIRRLLSGRLRLPRCG